MKFQVLPNKIKWLHHVKTYTHWQPEGSFIPNSIILQKVRYRERYLTLPNKIPHVKVLTCKTGTAICFFFLKIMEFSCWDCLLLC